MNQRILGIPQVAILFVLLCFVSAPVWAQEPPSACVEMGGLAWDDWTKSDAGGSGPPDGETDADYWRCKACHGWDIRGTDGGYIQRSRNSGRPNAGAGDIDQTSRNIAFSDRGETPITADMILHAGTGRSWEDGTGSWVPLDDPASPANKAAHSAGYTLGNQHPDFTTGGANALTQDQVDCLVEFLNFEDADWTAYFDAIYTNADPIIYMIRSDADAGRGETRYNDVCFQCHGNPAEVGNPFPIEGDEGILEFLASTAHFSEFYQKLRWGHPDSLMTRDALGDPTALDVADVMLYLQELGGTGFRITGGTSGTWYNDMRSGEGFLIDVFEGGSLVMVASFYTYDSMGNQAWLLGVGPVDGNTASLTVEYPVGAMWGNAFDPDDVDRIDWGTAEFTITSCTSGSMSLTPTQAMIDMGFTELAYDLVRLTTPNIACP